MSSPYRRLVAHRRLAAISVVTAAAVAAAVVGVSARGATNALSPTELAQLKAVVAKAQTAPTWHAPGPAVNAKKALAGKTIVTFPISSEIDACNTKGQQGYLDSEAKALGAKVIPLQSTTGPTGWQANIQQAITAKASAVVMLCG